MAADTNFAIAASLPRPSSRGPSSGSYEPLLTDTPVRAQSPEQRARRAAEEARDKADAAIGVALVLIGRFGCQGPGCASGHADHLALGRLVVDACDLRPAPKRARTPAGDRVVRL